MGSLGAALLALAARMLRHDLGLVGVLEERLLGNVRHDVVVFVLLAAEHVRDVVRSAFLLLCLLLLRLDGHDLLDLVLHLHDGVHHRHLCRRRLLLVRCQALLHQLELLLEQ